MLLRQVLQPMIRQTRSGVRSYHMPPELRPGHMDEAIVPCGSWKEMNDKNERSQNMLLLSGVVVFAATVAFGVATDLLFLNATVPKLEKK